MRTLKLSILASVMLLSGAISVKAQTADEVVDKYVAAIGGKDAWKKVTTVKKTGSITAQGMEIPISMVVATGKGMRMDLTISGMNNYQIVTPKEGWSYFPIQGQTKAEPMTADQVKQSQPELDAQGELVNYKEKGSKIALIGKDDVEGTQCYKVKLTSKDGTEKTMYFDMSNSYLIRQVQKVKADGKEIESTVSFSNYQKLPEGISVAMTMGSDNGDIVFKSVEVNKPVDESLFKPSK